MFRDNVYIVCTSDYWWYYDRYGGRIDLYNFLETTAPGGEVGYFVQPFYAKRGTVPADALETVAKMSKQFPDKHWKVMEWNDANAAAIWNAATAFGIITKDFERLKNWRSNRVNLHQAGKLLVAQAMADALDIPRDLLFDKYAIYNHSLGKYLCTDGKWLTAEEMLSADDATLFRVDRYAKSLKGGIKAPLWLTLWRLALELTREYLPPMQWNQSTISGLYFITDNTMSNVVTHQGVQQVESLLTDTTSILLFTEDEFASNIAMTLADCRELYPDKEWHVVAWGHAAADSIIKKLAESTVCPMSSFVAEAYIADKNKLPIERLEAMHTKAFIERGVKEAGFTVSDSREIFLEQMGYGFVMSADGRAVNRYDLAKGSVPLDQLKLFSRDGAEESVYYPVSLLHAILVGIAKNEEKPSCAYKDL